MKRLETIGVLGGGAWGTALAVNAHRAGRKTILWARESQVSEAMRRGDGNPVFLPDVALPAIEATTDMAGLAGCDAILAVVPAQFARQAFAQLRPHIQDGTPVILCAKGIEQASLSLMTDVLAETLPAAAPAVLSGPSFAIDVARDLPTAVTLACADETLGQAIMQAIGRASFRPYWSDDLVGAEIGGAVKNVLAIACGIVEGLGLGKSAHAALIARGFAEMTRLGVALGAKQETLAGLCGLGDLVLTCSSPQSRNMSFGMALGQGRAAQEILAERKAVTEGVATAPAMVKLAAKSGVELPICNSVNAILTGEAKVEDVIQALLSRPFRREQQ
ncbi:MAG: NAD(P)-dependent glycerol-3-phosphate dehydrogenase [Alphaproteobacteria bacterium]|nr:NAD(P)-dependent glycerol-3-phosphate dehydrogenase [Alphaproteobacteria bacterium]